MQRKYVRDGHPRIHWLPHFQQATCWQCGAWLEELPTTATAIPDRRWHFDWVCVRCKFTHRDMSGEPLATFIPDPAAIIAPPGSMPLPWSDWRLPVSLVSAVEAVADRYARRQSIDDVPDRPSVLDHSGSRRTAWGSFCGDADDPSGIRLTLAQLRSRPRRTLGARQAALLAERAVLSAGAVFEALRRAQPRVVSIASSTIGGDSQLGRILRQPPVEPPDIEAGVRVAPVIGWGRLSVMNRYEAWLLKYGAQPWFSRRYPYPRAQIAQGTEFLAACIELSDQLLQAFDLFQNSDSFRELRDDVIRLDRLMKAWRRFLGGGQPEPDDGTIPVKLPDPYWLTQWQVGRAG
jgi:hypothetical protein